MRSRLGAIGVLFGMTFFVAINPSLAQWEPDRRLTVSGGSSWTSEINSRCIAAGSGGDVHVVWQDDRDQTDYPEIYYKRSSDYGLTWGTDIRLTYSTYLHYCILPSVAVLDSTVHVVWADYMNSANAQYQIYYARSTDKGVTWMPDIRLVEDTTSTYPSIAASASLLHFVWADWRDQTYQEIYYKRSTDWGATWSLDTRLTFDSSEAKYPTVAASGSGVHVTWRDYRDDGILYSEIYYKGSTDFGITWGSDTRLTMDSVWTDCHPTIAASGPNIHLVWDDNKDLCLELYYRHSTNMGSSWSPTTRLTFDPDWSITPCIASSGSNVHLVWWDGRDHNYEIYYKNSSNNGTTWSSDTRLTYDQYGSQNPFIALAGPMIHVAWWDNRDRNDAEIYYKRNPTGNACVEGSAITSPVRRFSFYVSPNPFTYFVKVPGHEAESFLLYDLFGRLVGTYEGDRIGADLPPGVYFLKGKSIPSSPVRIVKVR